MKFIKHLFMVVAMVFASQAFALEAGHEYKLLSPPQPTHSGKKIEVLEFFWYGCPHCFHFEPIISKWKKSAPDYVYFVRVPAPLNPKWMVHTKTYYALELMGKVDEYHQYDVKQVHYFRRRPTRSLKQSSLECAKCHVLSILEHEFGGAGHQAYQQQD